jgi:S-DNA-T family DNA segregation ATPase FtsK/SpoIIIE
MPRPSRVRNVRYRTWGSGTRLLDELPIPFVPYYAGRAVMAAGKRWRRTLAVAVFWLLWGAVGLAGALLLFGVLLALGLTGWLAYRARAAEGGAGGRGKLSVDDMRAKATLRKQWALACRSAKLLGPESGEAPRLLKLQGNGYGTLTARVESGKIGVPVVDVVKSAARIADVVGCREVVVSPDGPGVAALAFHWKDPIGRVWPLAELPVSAPGQLAYGVRQDGSAATIRATQSVLIGGLTRHGKSNMIWALLADAVRNGVYVDLYVSDPKGGVELDLLEAQVPLDLEGKPIPLSMRKGPRRLVEVREYAKNPAETAKMLERAEKAFHARQFEMKRDGVKKIQPSEENPLAVVILDETLPLTDMLRKGTDSPLGRIAYQGAHAGYVVWANTQVAQIDAIGRFRDLIPQRVCFATSSREVTDAVLGNGAEALGAACSGIAEAGVGYSHSEGDKRYRKFRGAIVSDAESKLIAQGRLPARVVNAAREAYDRRAEEEASSASKSRRDRRTALYRWFYVNHEEYGNSLGYVGISYDVLRREQQHTAALREFMDGDVRRETQWFDTRPEAEAAERLAIESERPIHNKVFNGKPRRSWRKPRERELVG